MRFALTAPEKTTFGDSLALSPDGKRLAFIALAATGEPTLWVRTLDSVDAQKLQGTEGAATPFWSPDGRYIGFFAGGKLKTIEAYGGPIQILTEVSADTRGGTWGPDGTIVFSPNPGSPLFQVSVKGGPATQITELDQQRNQTSHRWPWFLPDGRHYLYFGRGKKEFEGIFVGSLDTSEKKFLLGSRVRGIYTGTAGDPLRGYLLYIHEGTLLARPFDVSKLELSGENITIAQHVLSYPSEFGPTGNCVISVSTNGHLVFRTGGPPITRPAWQDRSGKGSEPLVPAGVYREPMISADGKKIVLSRQVEGAEDIWLIDASHDVTMTRFTFDPAADVSPIWTPDASHIIFASNRNGKFELYQKGAGGAGADELILSADGNCFPHGITPMEDMFFLKWVADPDLTLVFGLFRHSVTANHLQLLNLISLRRTRNFQWTVTGSHMFRMNRVVLRFMSKAFLHQVESGKSRRPAAISRCGIPAEASFFTWRLTAPSSRCLTRSWVIISKRGKEQHSSRHVYSHLQWWMTEIVMHCRLTANVSSLTI